MGEILFVHAIPWMPNAILVAERFGTSISLFQRYIEERKIAEFVRSEIIWHIPRGPYPNMTDIERLCLSVMPRSYNTTNFSEILQHPYWAFILNQVKVLQVMES